MKPRDFNSTGKWSATAIQERYADYSKHEGVTSPVDVAPLIVRQGEKVWIYPVMDKILLGIRAGDKACALIGVEFLEEDRKFAWGVRLKSSVARALKQQNLPENLKERLRRRFVVMLLSENVPREFRYYAKLLRKVGFESHWRDLELGISRNNKYVMRHFSFLRAVHERSSAVFRREG